MEQKDYKLEITGVLLKNEDHARDIAKRLNTNHMIIVRKLKELSEENVVDFKKQGKNKTFFLKKTIESKTYALKYEHYRLIQTLRKYPDLRNIIEKIQKDNRIKLSILFGSYAKQDARKESDIDIYIEAKDKNLKKEIESINSKLSIKIGDFDLSSLLAKEIIKNHIIIKGVENFYERIKLFE